MKINELKTLLKCVVVCVCFSLFIGVVTAVLLRTSFLQEQRAYLFRLLVYAALGCIVLIVASILLFGKRMEIWGLSFSVNILCIVLSTLFMTLFFSLGPMTIERSYTIYSLADMTDTPEVIYSAEEIKERFISGYIEEANESQKRIEEQVYIGNMEEVEGGYRITEKGERLIKLMRFVEMIFPVPDENSIYPNGK